MCIIELLLDTALLTFFEIPFARKQLLARGSLLERVGFAGKVDTLGYILRATGLADMFETLLSNLREANEYRNLLAHAAIGPLLGSEPQAVSAMRFRRGRHHNTIVSVEGIAVRIEELSQIPHSLSELVQVLNALPRGDAGVSEA